MNLKPLATREELADAAADRPKVVQRAKQLRRSRQLWCWASATVAAAVAAAAISLTLAGNGDFSLATREFRQLGGQHDAVQ